MKYKKINLCLVLTEGMSFQLWEKFGILQREIRLYEELLKYGVHTTFVSFGNSNELKYKDILTNFDIICNRWGLPIQFYIYLINLLNYYKLSKIDIVKTNQVESINTATRISSFWKKPLLGRMGYFRSKIAKHIGEYDSQIYKDTIKLEKILAINSSKILLTTEKSSSDFEEFYPESDCKTIVIPNYVDTALFKPNDKIKKQYDLLYIGRLSEEKNINNLLEALIGLDIRTLFIGRGLLKDMVLDYKQKYNLNLELIEMIPNYQLPSYINSSMIFILPSLAEGNPKSLLEAMACQMPVIGSNVHGISNIITHNSNGILCDTTIEGIRTSINKLSNNRVLQNRLAKNARKYILKHCSLDIIVKKEFKVYNNILN